MNKSDSLAALIAQPIAHRGLHDGNVTRWENTSGAFRAAIAGGYAIELDVQLSGDGEAVVFHDTTLERLVGSSGRVDAFTATQLGAMSVGGTDDTITALPDILTLIAGRVPVVVEMKDHESRNADLAMATAAALKRYDGPCAAMSFAQDLVISFADHAPDIAVGLTAEGTKQSDFDAHRQIINRVDFVSYNVHHLPNAFIADVMNDKGLPIITWTVRTPEQQAITLKYATQITFEGFEPQW